VRSVDTVDAELRLLAAVRRSIREQGGKLTTEAADQLRDERRLSTKGAEMKSYNSMDESSLPRLRNKSSSVTKPV